MDDQTPAPGPPPDLAGAADHLQVDARFGVYYPPDEPGVAYLLRGHPGHWARVELDKLSTLTWPAQGPGGPYGPIKQEFGPPPELPPVVAWIGTGNNPIPVYSDPALGQDAVKLGEYAGCYAQHNDGDCFWEDCPQVRDNEPHATGRHCPRDCEDPYGD